MPSAAALFDAVKEKDRTKVEAILNADPALVGSRNEQGLTPLLVAVYHGAAEVVDLLRARSSSLGLHEAASIGEAEAIRRVLEASPGSVDEGGADGFTPLHLASFFGHAEAVGMLLECGADVRAWSANSMRNQPLHAAIAGARSAGVIRRLLEAGADVSAVGGGGYAPLHLAASRGDESLVDELFGRGAVAGTTEDGRSLADIARSYGHPELATRLDRRPG